MKSDHPLSTISEDTLQRARFARDIAKRLLGLTTHESLVVGIQGSWGSGKSTILNFLAEYIEDKEKFKSLNLPGGILKPVIVRFNPWWFSGQEDLFSRFFDEIGSQVSNKTTLEKAGGIFQWIATTAKLTLPFVTFGSTDGASETGIGAASVVAGVEVLKHVGENLAKRKSLDGLYRELTESLNTAQIPIWVLIDDIERLQPQEIKQMFALVRSVGDLPYLRYVLAYDPQTLEAGVDDLKVGGERYVEKIVQVPFTLPRPNLLQLSELFHIAIAEALQNLPEAQPILDLRLKTMQCFLLLKPVTTSVRSINRLSNSLSLSLTPVVNQVDLVDFILLEALKVFSPNVYRKLPSMKHRLIATKKQREDRHEADAENGKLSSAEETLNQLTEGLGTVDKHWVSSVLETLFPAMTRTQSWHVDGDLREHPRVSSLDSFDTYFELTNPELAFPKKIEELIPELLRTNPEAFTSLINTLCEESITKHVTTAFALAEAWLETSTYDYALQVINALSKYVDNWTGRKDSPNRLPLETQLTTISAKQFFNKFLTKFRDGEESLSQLSWLVFEVAHEILIHDATNTAAQRIVSQNLASFLEQLNEYVPIDTNSKEKPFTLPHIRSVYYLLLNWCHKDNLALHKLSKKLMPKQLSEIVQGFKQELNSDEQKRFTTLIDEQASITPELLTKTSKGGWPNQFETAKHILGSSQK
jgi:energy-coupling factor transporter ATP-binding protein EcfA2